MGPLNKMPQEKLSEIVKNFRVNRDIKYIKPFGNGHINDTFLVKSAEKFQDFILQRKNHLIFKDIEGMMSNIVMITSHIKAQLERQGTRDIGRRVIEHYQTTDNKYYFLDDTGNYWTLFNFITDSISIEKIDKPEQAYFTGAAFGRFQKQLSEINASELHETIKNFHNIYFRLENFENAIKKDCQNRLKDVKEWVNELLEQAEEMKTLQKLSDKNQLPLRITHNDTKINNILFDKNTGETLCIIDLDTVMPGLVHFDFGDAMRSGASTVAEDEKELSLVDFKLPIYENFGAGFLSETKSVLTELEKQYLPHSVHFMTYIMALRFMTDYLDGDVYYKITYPQHNLDRSKNQLVLIRKIKEKTRQMEEIIARYF
jgi:hypothetical protein